MRVTADAVIAVKEETVATKGEVELYKNITRLLRDQTKQLGMRWVATKKEVESMKLDIEENDAKSAASN
jgi:hypothetical protein